MSMFVFPSEGGDARANHDKTTPPPVPQAYPTLERITDRLSRGDLETYLKEGTAESLKQDIAALEHDEKARRDAVQESFKQDQKYIKEVTLAIHGEYFMMSMFIRAGDFKDKDGTSMRESKIKKEAIERPEEYHGIRVKMETKTLIQRKNEVNMLKTIIKQKGELEDMACSKTFNDDMAKRVVKLMSIIKEKNQLGDALLISQIERAHLNSQIEKLRQEVGEVEVPSKEEIDANKTKRNVGKLKGGPMPAEELESVTKAFTASGVWDKK